MLGGRAIEERARERGGLKGSEEGVEFACGIDCVLTLPLIESRNLANCFLNAQSWNRDSQFTQFDDIQCFEVDPAITPGCAPERVRTAVHIEGIARRPWRGLA